MDEDATMPSKKEKKTRRRLRLSCVECTKRRQKCDRSYPCSLCVSRGVPHLCRWETEPIARPPPARPPLAALKASGPTDQERLIEHLSARIASLEQALADKSSHLTSSDGKAANWSADLFLQSSPKSPFSFQDDTASLATSSNRSHRGSPSYDFSIYDGDIATMTMAPLEEASLLGNFAYETTSSHAQLSLAHHGEFIGRGSLICALHSISTRHTPRFLYAKSTDPTVGFREQHETFSSSPIATPKLEDLLQYIPPQQVIMFLTDSYFASVNWRFWVPEEWFRASLARLWAIQQEFSQNAKINIHWLILLFAILASAPQSSYAELRDIQQLAESSDEYFTYAMVARRVAEDEYRNKPNTSMLASIADGTVLGCLATPLLSNYLAERGRVSEAWKLVGDGIRNAQAVGMHRDPSWKLWQVMSEDETLLRRQAWWGLFVWDKFHSYVLGRPPMTQKEFFDVELPTLNNCGSRDLRTLGQITCIKLATLMGEVMEQCFAIQYPDCAAFLRMDAMFANWESHLPLEYTQSLGSLQNTFSSAELQLLLRQRYVLKTWCLLARIKLAIASTTGMLRPPQIISHMDQSLELCLKLSAEMISFQCEAHDTHFHSQDASSTSWLFAGCFSLFEASVALLTTIARHQWHEKAREGAELIDRSLRVFREVSEQQHGKTGEAASTAAVVLTTLKAEHWWQVELGNMAMGIKADPSPPLKPFSSLSGIFDSPGPIDLLSSSHLGEIPTLPSPQAIFCADSRYAVSAEREHLTSHKSE